MFNTKNEFKEYLGELGIDGYQKMSGESLTAINEENPDLFLAVLDFANSRLSLYDTMNSFKKKKGANGKKMKITDLDRATAILYNVVVELKYLEKKNLITINKKQQ